MARKIRNNCNLLNAQCFFPILDQSDGGFAYKCLLNQQSVMICYIHILTFNSDSEAGGKQNKMIKTPSGWRGLVDE